MTFNRKAFLSLLVVSALTACGGGDSEETGTTPVVDTQTNTAPVANAGEDISVNLGEEVRLSGSDSSDLDGDSLSYKWSITSAPSSNFTLDATANPSFTPSVEGEYVISLIVNDGKDNSESDTVVVTVIKPNVVPVAVISAEPVGTQGVKYLLSGETSSDEDGDSLTYSWSFDLLPEGSTLTADDLAQSAKTSFTPDVFGNYEIQLVVNDGEDNSESVSHTVSVEANSSPEVAALIDVDFNFGGEAYFYSSVTDTDSNEFTYHWEITSVPAGSKLLGFTADKQYLTYLPDIAGEYGAKVTVSDGFNSIESEVAIATILEQHEYRYAVGGDTNYFGKVNEPVLIDFATSTSPEGKELNYSWVVRSGPNGSRPSTSKSIVNKAETEFTGDKAGTYRIFVTMTDEEGYGNAQSIYVTLNSENDDLAPTPIVENPTFIKLGNEINLDGRKSLSPEGLLLSYKWEILYQPPTSNLKVTDASVTQKFTPSVPGYYNIQLTAYDFKNLVFKTTMAEFHVYEQQPEILAVTPSEIYAKEGETITLMGDASFGIDDSVTVQWDLLNAPYNSSSTINNENTLNPTFDLDVDGKFVFQLRLIQNEKVVSISHTTVRSEENAIPVANAGDDLTVLSGETVELSGIHSIDLESEALSYEWKIVGITASINSTPTISHDSMGNATLHVSEDYVGQVVVGLTVSDGEQISRRDEVIVTYEDPVAATRLQKMDFLNVEWLDSELPYNVSEIIAPIGDSGDGEQFLGMFMLHTEHADFTMTNIQFSDKNNVIEPTLKIVDYNYSLPADQQVELDYSQDITIDANDFVQISVISPADTGGKKALIELSFEILETGETFKAEFEYTSG